MKSVTGVFPSAAEAQTALSELRSAGLPEDRITLLSPGTSGGTEENLQNVPTVAAEQPGMGKAMGAVVGAAAGLSAGPLLIAALIPGVGPITAIGLLGGAILGAAGAGAGAVAGEKAENAMTEGLPEDELFVYEDALRQGRSVVIAMAEDDTEADRFREVLKAAGAERIFGEQVSSVAQRGALAECLRFLRQGDVLVVTKRGPPAQHPERRVAPG